MSELEVRLQEMRKDATAWGEAATEMRKAGKVVTDVKDLKEAFGYLGEKAGTDIAYAALNDTLRSLTEQADVVFRDVQKKLNTVIAVYEGTETHNRDLINGIKRGWRF